MEILKNRENIAKWLIKNGILMFEIMGDLEVNVDGHVNLYKKDIPYLPVQFNIVNGNFIIDGNELTNLRGCPKIVYGDFDCSLNYLKTLKECPRIVEGDFNCSNNKLTMLDFCPEIVGGNFICSNNRLKNLRGCPDKIGENILCLNNKIKTLKNTIDIDFNGKVLCSGNDLPLDMNKNLNIEEIRAYYENKNILRATKGLITKVDRKVKI